MVLSVRIALSKYYYKLLLIYPIIKEPKKTTNQCNYIMQVKAPFINSTNLLKVKLCASLARLISVHIEPLPSVRTGVKALIKMTAIIDDIRYK